MVVAGWCSRGVCGGRPLLLLAVLVLVEVQRQVLLLPLGSSGAVSFWNVLCSVFVGVLLFLSF